MTRRNAAERLFMMLEQDVRLRTLPAAAQLIWMKLMRLALAASDGGVLRFGSQVGFSFGFLVSVSLAVSHPESEIETALETLSARELVEILPDETGLRLPHAMASSDRVKAAQNNGFWGGRPRKGETSQQAYARRQGEMLMPIPGGRTETQETQAKPNFESSRAVTTTTTTTTTSNITLSGGSTAREETALVSLGTELAEIARLGSPLGSQALIPVQGWIDRGASGDLIRQAVRLVAQRSGYDPAKILTFGYFTAAIEDALTRGFTAPRTSAGGGDSAGAEPERDAEGLDTKDRGWVAIWQRKRAAGESTQQFEDMLRQVSPRALAKVRTLDGRERAA